MTNFNDENFLWRVDWEKASNRNDSGIETTSGFTHIACVLLCDLEDIFEQFYKDDDDFTYLITKAERISMEILVLEI